MEGISNSIRQEDLTTGKSVIAILYFPVSKSLPYPRCCVECEKESVIRVAIPYNAEIKHDEKRHSFFIPELHIDKCANCGEEYFSSETDGEISKELRVHLSFLQPEEIRAKPNVLGINQSDFAKRIGVAKESVSVRLECLVNVVAAQTLAR